MVLNTDPVRHRLCCGEARFDRRGRWSAVDSAGVTGLVPAVSLRVRCDERLPGPVAPGQSFRVLVTDRAPVAVDGALPSREQGRRREDPMVGAASCRLRVLLTICLSLPVLLSGCLDERFARYPHVDTMFPSAENTAYQRQDPFPDRDIGPSTDSAPRGYERPRASVRRAAEERLLRGVPVGPEGIPPGVPTGGLNRPRVVH